MSLFLHMHKPAFHMVRLQCSYRFMIRNTQGIKVVDIHDSSYLNGTRNTTGMQSAPGVHVCTLFVKSRCTYQNHLLLWCQN